MNSVEENLIAHLRSNANVSPLVNDRIHQNHVPETSRWPKIWLARSAENTPLSLSGEEAGQSGVLTQTNFDIECISDDMGQAIDLGNKTKSALHGTKGSFGLGTVQGVFVSEKDDQYVPKGVGDDSPLHWTAMTVTVWHLTT